MLHDAQKVIDSNILYFLFSIHMLKLQILFDKCDYLTRKARLLSRKLAKEAKDGVVIAEERKVNDGVNFVLLTQIFFFFLLRINFETDFICFCCCN